MSQIHYEKSRNCDQQHLVGDELEDAIQAALRAAPEGKMAQQIARAIGASTSTVRYRLAQLAAARVVRAEWHRRFLFYYLSDNQNDLDENEKKAVTCGKHVGGC